MDVVFHPSGLVHKYLLLMANAGQIRPGSRLLFFTNDFEPVFCAEDDVNRVQDQSVRQWISSRGRHSTLCRA